MKDKRLGQWGEATAERYLRCDKHYVIVYRNYRNALGEIDLIAVDKDTIVFVEVKTRRSRCCGRPAEAVESRKQHKIIQVAKSYLSRFGLWERPCRFDVVEVAAVRETVEINHICNAFAETRRF
ncbi:MAG: YraN family protein [Megasphaera sp.]|jgi:putative endonuclease|nr:YraN family protein [Megasphaera sp.]MCH4217096.1 YraN family protein [Megasphaera sp.]